MISHRGLACLLLGLSSLMLAVIFLPGEVSATRGSGSACSTSASGAPNDTDYFPYGFMCGSNPTYTGNATLIPTYGTPNASTNNGPQGGGYERILQGTRSQLRFTARFNSADRPPTAPKNGGAARVIQWVTIDINTTSNNALYQSVSGDDGTGTTRSCPGSSTTGIVYNFEDRATSGIKYDASPIAYDRTANPVTGLETCLNEGRTIYWIYERGTIAANQTKNKDFTLNIDTGHTGRFCLRENISVEYPTDSSTFPPAGAGQNDQDYFVNHVAKQSVQHCYEVYNDEPRGDLTTLNCSAFTLNGIRDPNHTVGTRSTIPIQWRIMRQNASGNGYTETISGVSSPHPAGGYSATLTNQPGPPGGFVTSTVYRLQVLDPDSGQWITGVARGGPSEDLQLTSACDPPQQNCNSLYVKDQDRFDPPGGQVRFYITRIRIFISDSSGRNLITPGTQLTGGADETYTFVPQGKTVTISIIREFYNNSSSNSANWAWRPYSDDANNQYTYNTASQSAVGRIGTIRATIVNDCYGATCTIDNVTDAGTGGVVQAGRPYRVWYTLSNPPPPNHLTLTSTLGGHALTMNDGGPHNISAGIAPGTSLSGYYDMGNAPPNDFNVSATPQYFGSFDLGPACGTPSPVIVYNTFTLTPWPEICTAAAGCDDEDPSAINYRTAVQSDRAVNNVPSEGYAALTPNGGARVNIASYNASKNFAAGSPPPAVNDTLLGVYPARPVNAGDRYCAIVRLSYSTGLVSNAGNIAPGTTSGPTEREACFTVKNKPYFKVLGSGVSAGGNFQSTGVCSGGGVIGGYYRDDSTDPYFDYGQGAGTDLYALATGEIKGFASAQSNAFKSPVELTFANSGLGASDVQNRQSDPNLGGKFAVDNCLTDVSEPSDLTFTQTFNGNTRIPGRTIGLGQNRSIFVNGDAYIDSSITYVDNGNWDYEKVPSFVLKATGNIYIDNSVGTLDGTYIAAATGPSTNGQIYTCAKLNPPNNFELVPKPDRLSQCNRQLTVHGSFVARKVNLMRTYGSIRDEKPSYGVPGQPIGGRVGVTSPLVWSHAGKPAGYNECVLIEEDAEPAVGVAPTHHGWNDNWLCLDPADEARVDLDWTHGGTDPYPGPGTPNCDNFNEAAAELDPYTWSDNVLCTNAASIRLTVAQFGNPAGPNEVCTQMYEPWDSDGTNFWQQNGSKKAYVCISTDLPSGGRTPDTLPAQRNPLVCSNSGGGASYTPRGGRLNTCAAEVFEFSPEFYLGQPATGDNEDEPIRFDALTSLPPVL